jgi:thiol-disulfide isomerase/thioredoxin
MSIRHSIRALIVSVGLTLAVATAQAQTAPLSAEPFVVAGATPVGTAFDAARLKGKVVMVFFWSTQCGVCLSHMPELRANLGGWKGKPFELVTVNVDANRTDWLSYEKISTQTQTQSQQPIALWSGKSVSPKLPLTLVLNTKGQVMARIEGRIAPEAWDSVAELLP